MVETYLKELEVWSAKLCQHMIDLREEGVRAKERSPSFED